MADDYRQPNIDEIKRFSVGIMRSADSDLALGTGVIVTDDGLIVTCYHVISDRYKKIISNTLYVSFPAQPGIRLEAQVLSECCNSSLDIAFLQLRDKLLPKEVTVANLSEDTAIEGHKFKSYGFKKQTIFKNGVYSPEGKIEGKVQKNFSDKNIALPEVIQLTSDGIDHGMSGAAILDKNINRVAGIVSEYLATSSNVDKNLALAIPVDSIIQVCPELKQKNPGLRILEFLRKIDAEEIEKYHRINGLFVPPLEYEEIKDILREHRIVFITGTKEYGKTYTAVRLLWEYFNKGYEPKWYSIEQEKIEGSDIRDRMLKIENLLKEHHIILFDDPFGKTQYEGNEQLERAIRTIKDTVENTEDAYIIITSREEIFKEFVRITGYDPKNLEVKMNLKTPSYDYEKRKEMLLKWAEVYNCKWLNDERLKTIVLEAIKDKTKLPTSLNIQDFAYATKNITNEKGIFGKIEEKSQETAWSFANEIKKMTYDKILFLSFPFISDSFSVDFIKAKYQELINELDIRKGAWSFERVLYHFKDDKIDISGGKISFSHPSYSEALPYLLLENGFPTEINTEIFSKVLFKLADDDIAANPVIQTIMSNFDKLSNNLDIVFRFAGEQYKASYVTEAVNENFDSLPDDVRNELLLKAWEKTSDYIVSRVVASKYDKLNDDVRNILFKITEKTNYDSETVADSVLENFVKIPANTRNALFLRLADDGRCAGWNILELILRKFDSLPSDIINQLLFKLADDEFSVPNVCKVAELHFDKLSYQIRNELLLKLGKNKNWDISGYVIKIITSNFDKVSDDVRKLLFVFADNNTDLANAIAFNFDKLPENVRNLLFKLADNKETAAIVAYAVTRNSDKIPERIRKEILRKSELEH